MRQTRHWIAIGGCQADGCDGASEGCREKWYRMTDSVLKFTSFLRQKIKDSVTVFANWNFIKNYFEKGSRSWPEGNFIEALSKHISSLPRESRVLFVYVRSDGFESKSGHGFTGPDGRLVTFSEFLNVLRGYGGRKICLFVDTDYSAGMCLAVKALGKVARSARLPGGVKVHVVASSMGRAFPFVQLRRLSQEKLETVDIPCGGFFLEIVKDVLKSLMKKQSRTIDERIANMVSEIRSRVLAQAPLVYRRGKRITIAGTAQEGRHLKTGKQKASQRSGARKMPKKARK